LEEKTQLSKFIEILTYIIMYKFIVLILLLAGINGVAQDLDVYKKNNNSNFDIPNVPAEMTYKEFKILSTNLRMQDMGIAMILPGHIHFKIGEKKKGYYILGTRMLGFAGWGYLAANHHSLTSIIFYDKYNIADNTSTGDKIIGYTSAVLLVGSYLYDWIHGKYKLDEKQNKIRYKYAKKRAKITASSINLNGKYYPALGLTYTF